MVSQRKDMFTLLNNRNLFLFKLVNKLKTARILFVTQRPGGEINPLTPKVE